MGSKHDLLLPYIHRYNLKRISLRSVAIVAGFLVGLLAGHLYHKHTKVVLVEHLYTRGGSELNAKPVKTSYGYKLVLHDFSDLVDRVYHPAGDGLRASISTIATSSSSTSSTTQAVNENGAGGTSSSSSTTSSSSSSSSGSSSSSSSSSGSSRSSSSSSQGQPRFYKGEGKGFSIMYSLSNTTSLTAADKQRISAVLKKRAAELPGNSIHALMTGNGSPYQNIQGRIMYSSMKMIQAQPGGDSIKAFTRIMHRTTDDDLVEEFPTFRAYPLQPSCDTWCEFPVKDRANAVVQWLMAAEQNPDMIQGAWLLLLESDYVWMKPLELPGSAHDLAVQGYGFQYDYIDPQYPAAAKVVKQMCPECDVSKVPRSGPSPVLIRPHELALVAPDWEVYSAWIENDDNARNVLGWVREMYAWCVAVHKNGVKLVHDLPPKSKLLCQPPHDPIQGDACMLHYTWGTLYNKDGKEFWRFDKRDWTAKEHERKVPQFELPPQPWEKGWKLQDGMPISQELHNITAAMLTQMNKASARLPVLTSKT